MRCRSLSGRRAGAALPSPSRRDRNGLKRPERSPVPTLLRFLFAVAVLAGLGFAAVFALATLVEPEPREMTVTIPASRLPSR